MTKKHWTWPLILAAFFSGLTPADKDTLNTRKGCKSPPAGLSNQDPTLYDFLANNTMAAVRCSRTTRHFGPSTLSRRTRTTPPSRPHGQARTPRIKAAWQAADNDMENFLEDPQREPRDGNEARWYLAFMVQKRKMKKEDPIESYEDLRKQFEAKFPMSGWDRAKFEWAQKANLDDLANRSRGSI